MTKWERISVLTNVLSLGIHIFKFSSRVSSILSRTKFRFSTTCFHGCLSEKGDHQIWPFSPQMEQIWLLHGDEVTPLLPRAGQPLCQPLSYYDLWFRDWFTPLTYYVLLTNDHFGWRQRRSKGNAFQAEGLAQVKSPWLTVVGSCEGWKMPMWLETWKQGSYIERWGGWEVR